MRRILLLEIEKTAPLPQGRSSTDGCGVSGRGGSMPPLPIGLPKEEGCGFLRICLRYTAASCLCVLMGRSQAAEVMGHSERMLEVRKHRGTESSTRSPRIGVLISWFGDVC